LTNNQTIQTTGSRRGGKRAGAGRKVGQITPAKRAIRDLALPFAEMALAEIARLAREAETESVRHAACRDILDRAYGRPHQSMDHNVKLGLSDELEAWARSFK
jgi:hypothetical protein